MAMSAKERKLSRLGSGKGPSGARGGGQQRTPPAGSRRRLFAAFFAFLCAGAVLLGGAHVIGGEPAILLVLPSPAPVIWGESCTSSILVLVGF